MRDYLENIVSNMTGKEKDLTVDQCQMLIDHWRLSDVDGNNPVPGCLTAKLLHMLYNGASVQEIADKIGRASGYVEILNRYNRVVSEQKRDRGLIEKHASGEKELDPEKLQEVRIRLEKAACLRDALWWTLYCVNAPLRQIHMEGNSVWVIDIDRC